MPDLERLERELVRSGAAWVRIVLSDRDQIAAEFFRWEVATAVLGAVLRIDPFDEPNVQESKDRTRRILEEFERTDPPRRRAGRPRSGNRDLRRARLLVAHRRGNARAPSLEMVLQRFLGRARAGEYVALLAYLPRNAASEASFALMRRAIRNALRVPVLQGYGPRYLHSIGQLYGGPRNGPFPPPDRRRGDRPAGPGAPGRSARWRWPRPSVTPPPSSRAASRCCGST